MNCPTCGSQKAAQRLEDSDALNAKEAHEMHELAIQVMRRLADEYPCDACDGAGELYPGHIWHPCYECCGTGYLLPDDEQ